MGGACGRLLSRLLKLVGIVNWSTATWLLGCRGSALCTCRVMPMRSVTCAVMSSTMGCRGSTARTRCSRAEAAATCSKEQAGDNTAMMEGRQQCRAGQRLHGTGRWHEECGACWCWGGARDFYGGSAEQYLTVSTGAQLQLDLHATEASPWLCWSRAVCVRSWQQGRLPLCRRC